LVTVITIRFVEEIRRESTLLQKFGDWVSLGSVGSTHKQDPLLQGNNKKAEIYMKVVYTRCQQLLRNYGLHYRLIQ
jgi:hypothetical protein